MYYTHNLMELWLRVDPEFLYRDFFHPLRMSTYVKKKKCETAIVFGPCTTMFLRAFKLSSFKT